MESMLPMFPICEKDSTKFPICGQHPKEFYINIHKKFFKKLIRITGSIRIDPDFSLFGFRISVYNPVTTLIYIHIYTYIYTYI